MKKIILILILLLPTLLFAQKNESSHQTIYLKKQADTNIQQQTNPDDYKTVIVFGKTKTDTITLSNLIKYKLDSILGYADSSKIISFTLTFGINGVNQTVGNNPGVFKKEAIEKIEQAPQGATLSLNNILYKSSDGKIHVIPAIRLSVGELGYNSKYTSFLAYKYSSAAIAPVSEILKSPKISIRNKQDSVSALGFDLDYGTGEFFNYSIVGDSIPKKVLIQIAHAKSGTLLHIRNIQYKSKSDGTICFSKEIVIRLSK